VGRGVAIAKFSVLVRLRKLTLWIWAALLWPVWGLAKPLTEEAVRNAKKIVLIPGTFDPFNKSHEALGRQAMEEGGADLVIYLPNQSVWHKDPSELHARLHMMDAALASEEKLTYPSNGILSKLYADHTGYTDSSFADYLRKLNPKVSLHVAVGGDIAEKKSSGLLLQKKLHPDGWMIRVRDGSKVHPWFRKNAVMLAPEVDPVSSTQAREWFAAHRDAYLNGLPTDGTEHELLKIMDRRQAEYILREGVYLDRRADNHTSIVASAAKLVTRPLKALLTGAGFYEAYKKSMVAALDLSETPPKTLNLKGKEYAVLKTLGSGLTSTGYLIDYDGRPVVVKKIRVGSLRGAEVNLRSIPLQQWLVEVKGLAGPELVDFDPNGEWVASEFIAGDSLEKILKEGKPITQEQFVSIERLYETARRLYQRAGVSLDFAPDNIVLRGGKAYLIDFGPIAHPLDFTPTFGRLMYRWRNQQLPLMSRFFGEVCPYGVLGAPAPVTLSRE